MDYIKLIREANEIAKEAVKLGNNPFGAVLVDEKGNILLSQGNIEKTEGVCTGHAELKLVESASKKYDKDFLKNTTLVTTVEPCAMCSGSIYWSGIGKVVYGISERDLKILTGEDERNLTMSLDCKKVLQSGQREIIVEGPFLEVRDEIIDLHKNFWI